MAKGKNYFLLTIVLNPFWHRLLKQISFHFYQVQKVFLKTNISYIIWLYISLRLTIFLTYFDKKFCFYNKIYQCCKKIYRKAGILDTWVVGFSRIVFERFQLIWKVLILTKPSHTSQNYQTFTVSSHFIKTKTLTPGHRCRNMKIFLFYVKFYYTNLQEQIFSVEEHFRNP